MTLIDPPDARTCERCGRAEVWSDDRETWVAADPDDGAAGNPHCVHVWDITGNYRPIAE